MTIVAIHQPQYLPWIPYFDKIDCCDIFVYLDNVQYMRGGFQNRNQIKTSNGPIWLTVPVSGKFGERILDMRIANQYWQKNHIAAIAQNYARAPYIMLFQQGLKQLLDRDWEYLVDLNIETTEWMCGQLQINTRRIRSSELNINGSKDNLVIGVCKELGAKVYLSGQGAKAYQDENKFLENGIQLRYQVYKIRPYPQVHSRVGFLPDLSALDLILNMGPTSKKVMLSGRGAFE